MSSQFTAPPFENRPESISDLAMPLAIGKGWIKFLAITQIVFASLYVLVSFGLGLIVAWLPIWLSIVLLQAAEAIERAQVQNDAAALKMALGKLRLYFMIQAIAMIVGFGLAILAIIMVITLGLSMANFAHLPH